MDEIWHIQIISVDFKSTDISADIIHEKNYSMDAMDISVDIIRSRNYLHQGISAIAGLLLALSLVIEEA